MRPKSSASSRLCSAPIPFALLAQQSPTIARYVVVVVVVVVVAIHLTKIISLTKARVIEGYFLNICFGMSTGLFSSNFRAHLIVYLFDVSTCRIGGPILSISVCNVVATIGVGVVGARTAASRRIGQSQIGAHLFVVVNWI
jgi:hypothetical protein